MSSVRNFLNRLMIVSDSVDVANPTSDFDDAASFGSLQALVMSQPPKALSESGAKSAGTDYGVGLPPLADAY
jgi:hypothetical protein